MILIAYSNYKLSYNYPYIEKLSKFCALFWYAYIIKYGKKIVEFPMISIFIMPYYETTINFTIQALSGIVNYIIAKNCRYKYTLGKYVRWLRAICRKDQLQSGKVFCWCKGY